MEATQQPIKPTQSQPPIPVIAHFEVFQITPDPVKAQAELVRVTAENYMTCMTLWKESEVFDFMSLFRSNRVDTRKLPQGTDSRVAWSARKSVAVITTLELMENSAANCSSKLYDNIHDSEWLYYTLVLGVMSALLTI